MIPGVGPMDSPVTESPMEDSRAVKAHACSDGRRRVLPEYLDEQLATIDVDGSWPVRRTPAVASPARRQPWRRDLRDAGMRLAQGLVVLLVVIGAGFLIGAFQTAGVIALLFIVILALLYVRYRREVREDRGGTWRG
jgi:hypothetical protein